MNENLNGSIVKNVYSYLSTTTRGLTGRITDLIKENIPQSWMANIILLIIACAVIFAGSKVTQKLSKFFLYVLGIILIAGIILNFIS